MFPNYIDTADLNERSSRKRLLPCEKKKETNVKNIYPIYFLDASYNSRRGVLRRWWYMELEDDVSVAKNAKQACLFGMTLYNINCGERWMLQKWANDLTTEHSPKPQSKQKNNNNKKQVNKQTTKHKNKTRLKEWRFSCSYMMLQRNILRHQQIWQQQVTQSFRNPTWSLHHWRSNVIRSLVLLRL